MCGIFGIYGHDHAAAMTHLGLYSLQHRGQESTGIVAVDIELGARALKKMGLVSEGIQRTTLRISAVTSPSGTRVIAQRDPRRSRTRNRFLRG